MGLKCLHIWLISKKTVLILKSQWRKQIAAFNWGIHPSRKSQLQKNVKINTNSEYLEFDHFFGYVPAKFFRGSQFQNDIGRRVFLRLPRHYSFAGVIDTQTSYLVGSNLNSFDQHDQTWAMKYSNYLKDNKECGFF